MRDDYKCPWCDGYHTWPGIVGLTILFIIAVPILPLLWFLHVADHPRKGWPGGQS